MQIHSRQQASKTVHEVKFRFITWNTVGLLLKTKSDIFKNYQITRDRENTDLSKELQLLAEEEYGLV